MLLSAVLLSALEGGFTALNPETGTTSQGESPEESLSNMREATEAYREEFPNSVSGRMPQLVAAGRSTPAFRQR